MTGLVARAVRSRFSPPVELHTLARSRPFMFRAVDEDGIVLDLGAKHAHTSLSWECLEGVPAFLRGRDWVPAGGAHSVVGEPGTLDEYLKRYIKRDTARWAAVLLAQAGVVECSAGRPLMLRLSPRFAEAANR